MTRDLHAHGFEADSRLIDWPTSSIADPCAREGATEPVDYADGIVAESERESPWIVAGCIAALLAAFAASAIWPCWLAC